MEYLSALYAIKSGREALRIEVAINFYKNQIFSQNNKLNCILLTFLFEC